MISWPRTWIVWKYRYYKVRNSRDNSYSGPITPRSPPTHHLSHLRVARQLGPRLAPILPCCLFRSRSLLEVERSRTWWPWYRLKEWLDSIPRICHLSHFLNKRRLWIWGTFITRVRIHRRRYKVVAEQYCKISPLICMVCLFFKL